MCNWHRKGHACTCMCACVYVCVVRARFMLHVPTYVRVFMCGMCACTYVYIPRMAERKRDRHRTRQLLSAGGQETAKTPDQRNKERARERERICTFLRDRRYARTSSASTLCPFPLLLLLPCSSSHFRPASVLPLCPSCRPVCLFRPFPIRPLHPARSFSPRCVHCVQTCRYAARVYLLRGSRQRSPLLGWFQREINRVQTRIAASG